MTDLERRALLGDRQAQEECTRQGIVLPCGCGNPAKLSYVERDPSADFDPCHGYVVTCCAKCGVNSWYHKTPQEAVAVWNNRAAPPIGRCKDCKYLERRATFSYCITIEQVEYCVYGMGEVSGENDFCGRFAPKE